MEAKDIAFGLVVAALAGGLWWQSSRTSALEDRLASLEVPTAATGAAPKAVARPQLGVVRDAPGAPPAAASAAEAPVDPAELEALVHRTLEQQSREREAEQTAKWVERGTRWSEKLVEGMVDEGLVPEAQREAVVTVLVNEMHDTMDMKASVEEGTLEEEQAWADWEALVAANDAALAELIGEASTATLRERTGRK